MFKCGSSQTYTSLLLLLPEPSEVISNFICAMCFYVSKSTGRNLPPQNLTQDWPLPSTELNVCTQDFLFCSGLLCSSHLNEIQRGSESSPFIFAINKGSVLWEFGGLRLLRIERFQGTALKLPTAPLDYFCRNCVLRRFLKVCLHTKYAIRYFPKEYLCSWPDLEKSSKTQGWFPVRLWPAHFGFHETQRAREWPRWFRFSSGAGCQQCPGTPSSHPTTQPHILLSKKFWISLLCSIFSMHRPWLLPPTCYILIVHITWVLFQLYSFLCCFISGWNLWLCLSEFNFFSSYK